MTKPKIDAAIRTKMFIRAAVAGAAGWDIEQPDPECAGSELVYLYVYDVATKKTVAAGIDRESFIEQSSAIAHKLLTGESFIEKPSTNIAETHTQVQSICGSVLVDFMDRDWSTASAAERLQAERQLLAAVTAYSGTTQTWHLANGLKDGGHFIVLFYRKPGAKVGLLRPVCQQSSTTSILPVTRLNQLLDRVQQHDKANNPSWVA